MKRVLVIGCPGSGKSVFSRKLADAVPLPLIHLDAHYHLDKWSQDADLKKQQWRGQVELFIVEPMWILDGNYKSTLDIRVPAADTIIFLDYPRSLVLWRLFKRYFQFRNRRRPDMPDSWREKISFDLLRFVLGFRSEERSKILALIDQFRAGRDIRVFRKPTEAEAYLVRLSKASHYYCLHV